MKETKRITDQLKRSFEGEAWHGPSVQEVLVNVSWEKAAAHPIPAAHSIWEITLHISAWQNFVCQRLQGKVFEATPEQDWPTSSSHDEDAWLKTLQQLESGYEKLFTEVSKLSDKDLDEKEVPGKPYNFYFMIHGVIQHNLFHAGQIALLKKA
jgi:uncharacterized damage-inducible protein DinB